MKKRTIKKSRKPRYITIKIQYYPLDKRLMLIPLFFLLSLVFFSSSQYFMKNWRPVPVYATETITTKSPINHELPFLQATTSPTVDIGENTVPVQTSTSETVVFHGARDNKEIALTFDADMTPSMKSMLESGEVQSYYDKRISDYLTQTQTKATLFLSGMWIELYLEDARELAANQLFELGNHSYSHPAFDGVCYGLPKVTPDKKQEEIDKTQVLLKNLTGTDNTIFRFPGGCYGQQDLENTKRARLTVIQWDVAGQDGFNDNTENIEENVLSNVHNGSIIVLHMSGAPNAPKTIDALPTIVETLKQKGFTFVKISELLHQEPPPSGIKDIFGL